MKNQKGITRTILKGILLAGGITVASTSPYFMVRVLPKIIKYARYKSEKKKLEKKKFYNAFYKMGQQGLVKMEYHGKQLHISLTEEGRERAGKYQVDDLKIKKSILWDKKWRILIFDIKEKNRIKREALRGKLKNLGLYQLQKSVWVYPYDFLNEINLLRQFFGLKNNEMKIITALAIEEDNDMRTFFSLSN